MEDKELKINALTVEIGMNKEINVKGKGKLALSKIKVENEKSNNEKEKAEEQVIDNIGLEFEHNDDANVIDLNN